MGLGHLESGPLLKHDYDYRHTTVREARGMGLIQRNKGKLYQVNTDTSDARMDIDSVKRKEEGVCKYHNLIPPKAIRAKLYSDACNGLGDFNTIVRKGNKGTPAWAKNQGPEADARARGQLLAYNELKKETRDVLRNFQTKPLVDLAERPKFPDFDPVTHEDKRTRAFRAQLGMGRFQQGVDFKGVIDKAEVLRGQLPTPPGTPVFGGGEGMKGPPMSKHWRGVHSSHGFFNDPQTSTIDVARYTKRRKDSQEAMQLIRERGTQSALNALWSNVSDPSSWYR